MAIETRVSVKTDFVEIRCRGSFAVDDFLSTVADAFRIARKECRVAVLMDITELAGEPSTMERFEVGAGVAHIQLGLASDVALAVVGKEPMVDPHRLAETVALNRHAWGKVFDDYGAAVAWIDAEISKLPERD
jgi:hypothetical protein